MAEPTDPRSAEIVGFSTDWVAAVDLIETKINQLYF